MSMSMMTTAGSEFGKVPVEAIVAPSDGAVVTTVPTTAPTVKPTDVVNEASEILYFIQGMEHTSPPAATNAATNTAATVSTAQGAKAGKAQHVAPIEFDGVEQAFLVAEDGTEAANPPAIQNPPPAAKMGSKGSKGRRRTQRGNGELRRGRNLQAEESMSLSRRNLQGNEDTSLSMFTTVEEQFYEAAIADSPPAAGAKGGKRGRRRNLQGDENASLSMFTTVEEQYFVTAAANSAPAAAIAGAKGGKTGRRMTRLQKIRNMQAEENMSMSIGTRTGNLRLFEWVDDGKSLSMQWVDDGKSLSMNTEAIVTVELLVADQEVNTEPTEAAEPVTEAATTTVTTAATTAPTTTAATTIAATTTAATATTTKAAKEESKDQAVVSWAAEPSEPLTQDALDTTTSQQVVFLQVESDSSEDGRGTTVVWASKGAKNRKVRRA